MARLVGINHVALEVDDIDAALEFYGRLFGFELRGRGRRDGLHRRRRPVPRARRRGERSRPTTTATSASSSTTARRCAPRWPTQGIANLSRRGLRFRDPWGNQIEVVDYREIQFAKTPAVLRGMGLEALEKTPEALAELREKGLG